MKKTLSLVACAAMYTFASANEAHLDTITVDGTVTTVIGHKG